MTEGRISQAMDRIDRALARIETQAALTRTGGDDRSSASTQLVARHESLRETVEASLIELDDLIERLEK